MEEQQNKEQTPVEAAPQGATPGKKKSMAVPLAGGLAIVLVIALIAIYGVVNAQVKNMSEQPLVVKAADVFGTPVAKVNGKNVSYADYVEDKKTLKHFYDQAPEGFQQATDEQLSDMAITRLVASELVQQVSKELGVKVKNADIEAKRQELLKNFSNDDELKAEIEKNYGWNIDTYIEKVIVPLVREEKLRSAIESGSVAVGDEFKGEEVRARHILFRVEEDSEDAVVKQKAQEVLDQIKNGGNFEELAKEHGSDGTSEQGGDLGWFGRGMMVKPFEDAVFGLEAGKLGEELVKTEFGYHIVKVDEKRQGQDFAAYMDSRFKEAKIELLVPIHNPFEAPQEDAAQ